MILVVIAVGVIGFLSGVALRIGSRRKAALSHVWRRRLAASILVRIDTNIRRQIDTLHLAESDSAKIVAVHATIADHRATFVTSDNWLKTNITGWLKFLLARDIAPIPIEEMAHKIIHELDEMGLNDARKRLKAAGLDPAKIIARFSNYADVV